MKILELDYDFSPRSRYPWTAPHPLLKRLLERNDARYAALLREFCASLEHFKRIPLTNAQPSSLEPHWNNGWLSALDSISIYGLLVKHNPVTYLEVGSGNSTKFARRAISDHGLRTRIISIDPEPRAEIDELCDVLLRVPFEEADPGIAASLDPESIVFIDNSHRCFQNSDVTVVFLELLPNLPVGVTVGLHDIFLPFDYPQEWTGRYYSEQYLLASFLLGGASGYEVTLPCCHAYTTPQVFKELAPVVEAPELRGLDPMGVAFWLTRTGPGVLGQE